ncbi:uncharacterized protein LOC113852693 [Abrus precatorius]|uniref:Uncharacterized protein LOC113852693 n=1 Tax=Abrus precatorius TaxID=3816 RepID=A0A8B8K6U4_ABRPR|nr:uncharacterized protein LOC113852693 [Abrus precatorius]
MQGPNRSVIMLKSVGFPLEVNTTMHKGTDNKTGVFSVNRCMTYTLGRRFVSLNITLTGKADRVNNVLLEIFEKNGMNSSAHYTLRIIRNDKYGVLCKMNSRLSGFYDSYKDHYCVPPLSNTEIFYYFCHENRLGGFFFLEKNVINEVVERVKATHAFDCGDETVNVKIKVRYDQRVGLIVDVEDPVKVTTDYTIHVIKRIKRKIESKMEDSTLSLYRNVNRLPPPNGNNEKLVDDDYMDDEGDQDEDEEEEDEDYY